MNVYYIAYNQDMTVEYIQACAMWARAFNYAASEIEEGFWEEDDDDKHIKTYTIKFPDSGFRIVALSSRPSNLRGRQGIIVIDEAAFHEQLDELLKAALAMLIWGERYALSPPMTVTTIRSIRLSGISVPDVREAAYIASLSGKPYLRPVPARLSAHREGMVGGIRAGLDGIGVQILRCRRIRRA